MAKAAKAVEEKAQQEQSSQDDASPAPASSDARRGGGQADSKKQVQSAEFPEAVGTGSLCSGGKLDIILDMNVPVTVAIGQTEIPVRRLLQIGPGSVLKLGKPIDEPADLYLKDAKFAAGDVVVVDGRFAVRIKEVIGGTGQDENSAEDTVHSGKK